MRCSTQEVISENDEVAALNLSRSAMADVLQQLPTKLLKPKKFLNVSTFNIRTGREDWRISELAQLMDQYDISIIDIQGHRRVHEEEIKYEHIDNHLLITSSALRNSSQAATGGVGFLLNKKAEAALCEINSISHRIIKA